MAGKISKKILITGAGGYIGSVGTYFFLRKNFEIVAIDNFSTGFKQPFEVLQKKFGKEKLRYYDIDLRNDLSAILKQEKDVCAVIHYAGPCSVDESMRHPEEYFSNNVCGSQNLLELMLQRGIKNIVFSSTCSVYGEAEYIPVDENHSTNPTNPYGESKRIAEMMIEWYGKLKGLRYVILRYFNVCGASDDGLVGDSKKPSIHLVQNAVRGALGIEPFYLTCPEVETFDKTPIRDYINVVDLNEAHFAALEYLLNGGSSETINLGTGRGNSVLEIIHEVQKVTGIAFGLKKAKPREGEYAKMIASTTKAKKVLGWKSRKTISDSIKSLFSWYKNHPKGWKN